MSWKVQGQLSIKLAHSQFHVNEIQLNLCKKLQLSHFTVSNTLKESTKSIIHSDDQSKYQNSNEWRKKKNQKWKVLNCKLFVRKISNNNSQLICIAWVLFGRWNCFNFWSHFMLFLVWFAVEFLKTQLSLEKYEQANKSLSNRARCLVHYLASGFHFASQQASNPIQSNPK